MRNKFVDMLKRIGGKFGLRRRVSLIQGLCSVSAHLTWNSKKNSPWWVQQPLVYNLNKQPHSELTLQLIFLPLSNICISCWWCAECLEGSTCASSSGGGGTSERMYSRGPSVKEEPSVEVSLNNFRRSNCRNKSDISIINIFHSYCQWEDARTNL